MLNQVFFRPHFNDFIEVFNIETHKIENRKKIKLDKPIYHIKYHLNYKKPFTTYLNEIENMVSFKRWVPIKEL